MHVIGKIVCAREIVSRLFFSFFCDEIVARGVVGNGGAGGAPGTGWGGVPVQRNMGGQAAHGTMGTI